MTVTMWIQWLGATMAAGVGGSFILMSYLQSSFISVETFTEHKVQPHPQAVQESRYNEDLRVLRQSIDRNSDKLDKILDKLSSERK